MIYIDSVINHNGISVLHSQGMMGNALDRCQRTNGHELWLLLGLIYGKKVDRKVSSRLTAVVSIGDNFRNMRDEAIR